MSEVLSQNEIDALLNAVGTGESDEGDSQEGISTEGSVQAGVDKSVQEAKSSHSSSGGAGGKKPHLSVVSSGESGEPDWIAYDLASQEKFVRGKLVALEGINERFARLLRMSLSTELNKSVSVSFSNTNYLKFSEYLSTVLPPASMSLLHMKSPRGYMIFVVGSKLAYALIDAFYGGTERPYSKVGGREEFTNIEKAMIQKIVEVARQNLVDAWKLNYDLELDFLREESNPHFVGSIHGSETVAVVSFEVEMDNLSGPFVIILQLRSLDAISQYLNANVPGEIPVDKELWRKHWLRELGSTFLDVKVNLGTCRRTLTEISQLKVGDEIILDKDAASPLQMKVEGIPKYSGVMGVCKGSSALRVTEKLPIKTRRNEDG